VIQPSAVEGDSRNRLVLHLRRGLRTVDELARAVGLTPNAVRQHLAVLERDGIVVRRPSPRAAGARPRGKPPTRYEIAPDAGVSFSRAYAPVLTALLTALPSHLAQPELGLLLRDTGERLAAGAPPPPRGDLRQRAVAGVAILESLGGLAELTEEGGAFVITGCSCPLAQAVAARPELCSAIEILLSAATGAQVAEHCHRTHGARCRFVLSAAVSS
jgi:predicted ArsR family transcriptional regulator